MARKSSNTPVQHRQNLVPLSAYRFLGSADNFVYTDDRLRPTWSPHRGYRLTAEHRCQLCVHVAAHAAVNNRSGAWLYKLAVAPVGVRSWTIGERKAQPLGKIWALCSVSDYYCKCIEWAPDSQRYVANREFWEWEIRHDYEQLLHAHLNPPPGIHAWDPFANGVPSEEEFMASFRRIVRAQACGYLAGHVADGITAGMEAIEALRLYDRRDTENVGPSDIAIAQGLADLLPPGEYEHAVRLTEETLRRPEVWRVVQRVASELEQLGLIEGDPCEGHAHDHLPDRERGWPPAPSRADFPQQA
jgi:hypothetical protein